jgi:hypothetical protein
LKSNAELRILEIGQFCLFKRNLPDQTTLVFTGENMAEVDGVAHRVFDLRLYRSLAGSLARGDFDIVMCHTPVRPVWDRRHGFRAAMAALLHRLRAVRTLGTYVLRGRYPTPLVLLDFNDEPNVPAHVFPLLDRAVLGFKRELPTDAAKAFLDSTWEHRTHQAVMSSPFVQRNLAKLRPIPIAIAEETVRLAMQTDPTKEVDVFYAGGINSTLRAAGLPVLQSLQAQGYRIDVCKGGLSKREYLARCARAWLTWSPEGYGWECFRHYEASLCLSVPLLSPPGILRYRPLEEGVHAVYYSAEGEGLRQAIVAALADKAALMAMAQAARTHTLRHHTHSKVVEHILDSSRIAIQARRARRRCSRTFCPIDRR